MKKLNLFFIIIGLSFSFNSFAIGEISFPKLPSKKKSISMEIKTEYFNTISNYKFLGEYDDLQNKNFFNYGKGDLSVNYTFSHWFKVETFVHTIGVASKSKKELRNRLGFTYTGLGLTFFKRVKDLQINFEVKGGIPLHKIPEDTDEIVIGDGAYFVTPSLWLMYVNPSKLFYLFYNVNYLYRTHYLSSILSNKLGFVLQTHLINFGFSTDVFLPIMPDAYSQTPEKRWKITDRVNGGSYRFYSINPGVLSFTSWMEWKLQSMSIKLYGNIDTYGKNYSKGITLGLVTSYKWNTKVKKRSYRDHFFKKRKRSTSKRYEYYEEEDDNENEELMNELNQLRR